MKNFHWNSIFNDFFKKPNLVLNVQVGPYHFDFLAYCSQITLYVYVGYLWIGVIFMGYKLFV